MGSSPSMKASKTHEIQVQPRVPSAKGNKLHERQVQPKAPLAKGNKRPKIQVQPKIPPAKGYKRHEKHVKPKALGKQLLALFQIATLRRVCCVHFKGFPVCFNE